MTQIEFNDENQINRNVRPHQTSSGFSKKLISWGLAKNEQQANIYLFILDYLYEHQHLFCSSN